MIDDETSATLHELFVRHRDRGAMLFAAYEAQRPRDRRRVTVLTYYCPNRKSCELLSAWQSPAGRLVRLPNYKLSPTENVKDSSESGRAKSTRDGDRHWKGAVVLVDELWPEVHLPLNCDHYRAAWPVPDLLADLASATPAQPVRRVISAATA